MSALVNNHVINIGSLAVINAQIKKYSKQYIRISEFILTAKVNQGEEIRDMKPGMEHKRTLYCLCNHSVHLNVLSKASFIKNIF